MYWIGFLSGIILRLFVDALVEFIYFKRKRTKALKRMKQIEEDLINNFNKEIASVVLVGKTHFKSDQLN